LCGKAAQNTHHNHPFVLRNLAKRTLNLWVPAAQGGGGV
jgi:hypothetical protein